ncbi:MAG: hypothetical protein Q7S21_01305 [archaeon]|nr:hypothetical protein [archaeon]
MPTFFQSMKDALNALIKYPKLFIPKIFLAIIWGTLLLMVVDLFQKIALNPTNVQVIESVGSQLPSLILITLIVFLIDVFVNAMYPLMIADMFDHKKVSMLSSFKEVQKNSSDFLIPIIVSFIISMILILPFTLLFSFSIVSGNPVFIAIAALLSLISVFIISVVFYFIFPVIVLEKKGMQGVWQTLRIGRKHFKEASFGTLITFIFSVLTAVIASFSGFASITGIASIALFLFLRILTAIAAAYQIVLNPVLYLEYVREKR